MLGFGTVQGKRRTKENRIEHSIYTQFNSKIFVLSCLRLAEAKEIEPVIGLRCRQKNPKPRVNG